MYYMPVDLKDSLSGNRHPLSPPKGMVFTGSGDFINQGQHHLDLLRKYSDLKPECDILDVGSGMGRTAVALTEYLNESGSYQGIDVVERAVAWCSRHITERFPNFRFRHISVANDLYNKDTLSAASYIFPFKDQQFDLVSLFSVFTHMQPEELENYLSQIWRVLRSGGKCIFTVFSYDDDIESIIASRNEFSFPIKKQNHRLMHAGIKSANVAFDLSWLLATAESIGFDVVHFNRGFWYDNANKNSTDDFQDLLILAKKVD